MRRICATLASVFMVLVLVMDCTRMGLSPPKRMLPTVISWDLRRVYAIVLVYLKLVLNL